MIFARLQHSNTHTHTNEHEHHDYNMFLLFVNSHKNNMILCLLLTVLTSVVCCLVRYILGPTKLGFVCLLTSVAVFHSIVVFLHLQCARHYVMLSTEHLGSFV